MKHLKIVIYLFSFLFEKQRDMNMEILSIYLGIPQILKIVKVGSQEPQTQSGSPTRVTSRHLSCYLVCPNVHIGWKLYHKWSSLGSTRLLIWTVGIPSNDLACAPYSSGDCEPIP